MHMFRFPRTPFARSHKRNVLLALLGVTLLTRCASAVDILVTTAADSAPAHSAAALTQAVSGDRIVFDIPGTPTILLASDLPTITGDISFANNNVADVTIDRNGNGPLTFTGGWSTPPCWSSTRAAPRLRTPISLPQQARRFLVPVSSAETCSFPELWLPERIRRLERSARSMSRATWT